MNATATIREYYDALRDGTPLEPYFVASPNAVKFGITECLTGYEEIAAGLRTQTETTTDWQVESRRLVVGERATHAWFGDEVSMAWTDLETEKRHAHETRWSGTLERGMENGTRDETDDQRADASSRAWRFASMHVSRSEPL